MKEKGFTLIELLIVLALIAILAAILIVIVNPGQIFIRARDTQRQGDLRNLSTAVDTLLAEISINNLNVDWPERGNCSSTSPGDIFFSVVPPSSTTPPSGWPSLPAGANATGTLSIDVNGNGWVPLNFSAASTLNLSSLPVDPRNNTSVGGFTFAYSFACTTNYGYEFAARLEGNTTLMQNDGGNQANLYEVGPDKNKLY